MRLGSRCSKTSLRRSAMPKRTPVRLLDIGARGFHQAAVFHARRARGLAGAAGQAQIDVLADRNR